jgi:hypothetical protein
VLLVTATLDYPLRSRIAFGAGFIILLAGFFFTNTWLYGKPLGMHAIQAVEPGQIEAPHPPALSIAYDLGRFFLLFSPVLAASAAIALAGLLLCGSLLPQRNEGRLWVVLALFFAGTPFLLSTTGGKQFGPRFWLPAVPVLWMIASLQLQRLAVSSRRIWSKALGSLILLSVCGGGIFNVPSGTLYLRHDYRERVLPALDFLRTRHEVSVAASHQYIAQELESLFGKKHFFRVLDLESFMYLAERLFELGEKSFQWISHDSHGPRFLTLPGLTVRRDLLGRYGEYHIFSCSFEETVR